METAIVSILCIALVMVGGLTMSQGFIASVDTAGVGIKEISIRDEDILRTNLSVIAASTTGQAFVNLTLKNTGQTKVTDFSRWDFILQYTDTDNQARTKWLPYTSGSLGNNQWEVVGIYISAASSTPEVFELNILNPGEEIKLKAKVLPAVKGGSNILANVVVPNGVSATAILTQS